MLTVTIITYKQMISGLPAVGMVGVYFGDVKSRQIEKIIAKSAKKEKISVHAYTVWKSAIYDANTGDWARIDGTPDRSAGYDELKKRIDRLENAAALALIREYPIGSKVFYRIGEYTTAAEVIGHNIHADRIKVRGLNGKRKEYWLEGSRLS